MSPLSNDNGLVISGEAMNPKVHLAVDDAKEQRTALCLKFSCIKQEEFIL